MDENYFSTKRLRKSSGSEVRTPKQLFESDRGRVLFSAPLRRLQSKAQVFSLESNAAVRSRLTHSIEVAHVGRYISHQLYDLAIKNNDTVFAEQCKLIEPIVETACLLHDIGNPPFGHLGENAIKEWFMTRASKVHKKSLKKKLDESNPYYLDFRNFDGNPQGIRIVVTLQGFASKKGLNLTFSQLGSLIKYPQFSSDEKPTFKKNGVFTSEKADVQKVWTGLGLQWGCRHPCVYLMEAADDIAYSLSDIEDGIEKGVISEDEVLSYLRKNYESFPPDIKNAIPDTDSNRDKIVSDFVSFRTKMINLLTYCAAEYFYNNKDSIHDGTIKEVFDEKISENHLAKALDIISKFCQERVYCSKEAQDIEIAGYNIVYGIFDKFSTLLELSEEEFSRLVNEGKGKDLARRMLSKIPDSLIAHYSYAVEQDKGNEWFFRCQVIIDYVSGMTDDFALKVYKLLNGIEIQVV